MSETGSAPIENTYNTLSTRSIVEKTPFAEKTGQAFFTKWSAINDGIIPQFLPRAEWTDRKDDGLLTPGDNGKKILIVPEDMHLWEMIEVMEVVDQDTYAQRPELRDQKKVALQQLGTMFKNSGIYIANRIDAIHEGRELAEEMSQEFYSYGNALLTGEYTAAGEKTIEEIASESISEDQVHAVDIWLAGDKLYAARMGPVLDTPSATTPETGQRLEVERQRTLSQFFRVAEKAHALEEKDKIDTSEDTPISLEQPPIHTSFLDKIHTQMQRKLQKPEWELSGAILRRGIENLFANMKAPGSKDVQAMLNSFFRTIHVNTRFPEITLQESLQIGKLKDELVEVRQEGNTEQISGKELEIIKTIQQSISSYKYEKDSNNPTAMIKNKEINCLGASLLGGKLLEEAGINYAVVAMPEHALTFVTTSDGKVYVADLLKTQLYEVTKEELAKERNPHMLEEIADFIRTPSEEGLRIDFLPESYRKVLQWYKRPSVATLYKPEVGIQVLILDALGAAFAEKKRYEEANIAFDMAIITSDLNPNNIFNHAALLLEEGKIDEGIEQLLRTIELCPQWDEPYYYLAEALVSDERGQEAIQYFDHFIALADTHTRKTRSLVRRAKRVIKKLRKAA